MIHIARKVKCQRCKESFERLEGNYVKLSNGYAHKTCEEEYQMHMKERAEFIKYICEVYGFDHPDMIWLKEMKRYHEERNYRYAAMQLTLKYAFEVQGLTPDPKYRLGIIPTMYEEAKRHFQNKKEATVLEQLIEYICQQYNIPRLTKQMDNQLEEYLMVRKYTHEGILIALKYGFEHKNRSNDQKYGIGFVPYLYEEAQRDFQRRKELRKTKLVLEERVVKVVPKEYKSRVHQIDMSQFEGDEN